MSAFSTACSSSQSMLPGFVSSYNSCELAWLTCMQKHLETLLNRVTREG